MKTTAVKGMNDYLPSQADLRDYMEQTILQVYKKQGFERIYTPIVEDIENLQKSDGGENLNLIFKILKRGEKLEKALSSRDFDNLCDAGLRYDLTLPLSRYFACHKNELSLPFKAIQIGTVYRAERPQKGRDREFKQCDIDILGSSSENCEIELIDTTARALKQVGIKNFTIRISSRILLRDMLAHFGFDAEDFNSICITFDKLDKIGTSGVVQELTNKGFNVDNINKFALLLNKLPSSIDEYEKVFGASDESLRLKNIIDKVCQVSDGDYPVRFDLTLVRGQGYYTSTVFEIESSDFNCSIGGGGRYDNMIGKFCGDTVPAVGFSIGFERIYAILKQNDIKLTYKKIAVIYDEDNFVQSLIFQKSLQKDYYTKLFERPKKLGKLLSMLEQQNYYGFVVVSEGQEIRELKGNK